MYRPVPSTLQASSAVPSLTPSYLYWVIVGTPYTRPHSTTLILCHLFRTSTFCTPSPGNIVMQIAILSAYTYGSQPHHSHQGVLHPCRRLPTAQSRRYRPEFRTSD